jgi:hypothetical protein
MAETYDRSGCTAPRHGDESAYSWWKCRCPDAREAWRLYQKRIRGGRHTPRMVDSTGTARRLQALQAIGYCWRVLAVELELSPQRVANLARQRNPVVYPQTEARIRALYETLHDIPAPSGYASARALATARKEGWHDPEYWDGWNDIDDPQHEAVGEVIDEVAIEQALSGVRVQLTGAELLEAVAEGLARPMSRTAIALALHVSGDRINRLVATVERRKAAVA